MLARTVKSRSFEGGRQKGTPNRETKALRDLILGALEENGGQDYLAAQARQNPVAFLTLLGKVLQTTLASDPETPVRHIFAWASESLPSKTD
jgi:hypothetical protein